MYALTKEKGRKKKRFVYACKVNEICLLSHFLTSVFDSCYNKLKAIVIAPRIGHVLESDVVGTGEECAETLFGISCKISKIFQNCLLLLRRSSYGN
jgi:hypothetical protein